MGKSLQPHNATAVRQPVNNPSAAPAAVATPAPSEPVTAESLGWQLRAALPPIRLHSVSLYDEQANVLWLSEGALGPDEHNLVVEAIDALGNDTTLNCYENGLEDGRVAVFLPVRSPQGSLVGLAMILADIKSVNDNVIDRMVTPQVRTVLQKLAVLLRPAPGRAAQGGEASLQILEFAPDTATSVAPVSATALAPAASATAMASGLSLAPSAPRNAPGSTNGAKPSAPASPVVSSPAAKAVPVLSPQAVDDILEFELGPEPPAPAQKTAAPTPAIVVDRSLELAAEIKKTTPPIAAPRVISGLELPAAVAAKAATVFAANVATFPTVAPAAPLSAVEDEFAPPIPIVSGATPAVTPTTPAIAPPTIGAAPATSSRIVNGAPTVLPPTISAAPTATANGSAAAITVNGTKPSTALNGSRPAAELNGSHPTGAINGSAAHIGVNGSASAGVNGTPAAPPNTAATSTSKTLTGRTKALAAGATSTSQALQMPDGVNLILEVQPFSKLRAGGRTRRFEVIARSSHPNRVPSGIDHIALQRLLAWMGTNRAAWSLEPTSFTLNLSITTLEDERFPQFVASNLKQHGIAPDNIGFEIAEPLCLQRRAQVERFISLCDKLGCFVVIDDFSLDSTIVSLLRSKALRLVKIDPKLTSVALKDKLAQAMVVAIAQAVKVLGIHCAAKRVESQAALQWLTAIGCDFAQGTALAQVQPLEALGAQPAPPPGAG
jgi:EAL domain-containing protein (putative c-di-GMP-specific phosphodiesterase class I)